jgi:hypothetical protein
VLITKNQNLNLNTFLHSITCSLNKKINKQFNIISDTNDVNISLNNLLNFDLIKNYFKLRCSVK